MASVLIFQSCSDDKSLKNDFDPKVYLNHIESYSKSYEDCDMTSESCTYISISYPVFDVNNTEGIDKISEHIKSIVLTGSELNAEKVCGRFISDYSDFINDSTMKEEGYNLAWYDVRSAEIISIQKKVISLKSYVSSFYGGAHPNEYVYLRNFIPETGDSLGLGMIFTEESLLELSHLAEYSFRKSKHLSKNASLESEGYWFEDDQFELTPNFAFTEQGLWFYYNNYEIAPYSMGPSEIILPYNIIMHLFQ